MKTQILTFFGSRKAIPLLFLVSLFSSPIYAVSNDKHLFFSVSDLQQDTKQKPTIKLTGTVKDSFGALGGVIVTVGTTIVTTDLDGKYTTYITSGDKITFSMMGYKDQSIDFVGGNVLNITLSEDSSTLEEIVVNAGYYSVKDRERTGSIARVTAKDIEFQPVTNPLQALQGRMAGVSITQNSGVPGGGFDIQIRGRNSLRTATNSLYDGNLPLYIVDGVPISSDKLGGSSLSIGIIPFSALSPLSSLNPNDIESIEILKDADATAIYGSKGANGVILITTKRNKSEKTSFTLSSSTAFSHVASKMKLLNTSEFNQLRDKAFINDKITNPAAYEYDRTGDWDKNRYTNWQKELIGGTALSKNISFGVSNSNQYTQILFNTSHNEETTVFPTDNGYKRNSFLLNVNHNSKDSRLTIGGSANYSTQNSDLIATDLTKTALTLPPNAPSLYNEDGSLNWQNGTFNNPLAPMQATYSYSNKTFILNTNISYQILPNTTVKVNSGLNSVNFTEYQLTPHTINNPNKGFTSDRSTSSKAQNTLNSYIIEPQLNWNKNFGNHSISVLIGATFQESTTDNSLLKGTGYASNSLITNINAAKTKTITSVNNLQYKYLAYFGRINYSYNQRYFLNITGRRDGSSRFGQDNRFANFGAIGAAWLFSEEKWLKDLNWLSFGKLRSSYGTAGSDNIGDYQYLDTYSVLSHKYDDLSGLTPSRLNNPNFSWEKTTKFEIALELSLFNQKINPTIAYYKNKSSNQLVGIPLPSTTGFTTVQANLPAIVQNKGIELTLNTININGKDWKWSTNFNISFPENKLLSFPSLEGSTYANRFVIGKSTNIKKVYHYQGIDNQTGMYLFEDYNNDDKITSLDKQGLKEIEVKYHGGLQNSISYKNFNLDFLFQFVKQTNYNYNYGLVLPGVLANQPVEILDHWSKDNPNANYSYYTTGLDANLYQLTTLIPESDKAIGDASYIRLKNVSLAYTLDLPKLKNTSLKLYIQGQNLWTITNYFGLDPEFGVMNRLPPLRTYAFGFQLTF
ncbi:SusC/RagA family TonB-linked outer membrane protein [Myroides marinus]|uniref:SusC/RagA family TonB-linked outer membrane protein n=1 Tax=Myroides marinus TaxID=703342 RepID=UPI002574BC03|nr:SusC/RagA family TonB-linked outer membrane protein [Myroides marinus]MDM1391145.1 SusC/RagA family TonB-linked outer membrane protein [Myroides marinus]